MFGATLLQKHYVVETEEVKGIRYFHSYMFSYQRIVFVSIDSIVILIDDEGVDTGGTSSNESNSPIK